MRSTKQSGPWVVYRMNLHGQMQSGNCVCDESEWTAMEASRPGEHVLVKGGIATEEEAEKLARGTAGDPVPRQVRKKPAAPAEKPVSDSV